MRAALGVAVALCLSASAGLAQDYVQGNDTGGIIPWSCENEVLAPDITAAYCARWNKYPRITGVHRQYGDYISFHCLWTPRTARYALPAVRTRAVCRAQARDLPVKARY